MSKILSLLMLGMFVFLIGAVSAIICTDNFDSSLDTIQICGYCSEENGSICSSSVNCNFTIYQNNFSYLIQNATATNNGDGSFTYDIAQNVNGVKNLSDGDYFGTMNCGSRSYDDFDFKVSTSVKYSAGYGGQILNVESKQILNDTEINRIPNDLKKYSSYVGSKLIPSNPKRGKIFFWAFIISMILIPEIYLLIKSLRKMKNKW